MSKIQNKAIQISFPEPRFIWADEDYESDRERDGEENPRTSNLFDDLLIAPEDRETLSDLSGPDSSAYEYDPYDEGTEEEEEFGFMIDLADLAGTKRKESVKPVPKKGGKNKGQTTHLFEEQEALLKSNIEPPKELSLAEQRQEILKLKEEFGLTCIREDLWRYYEWQIKYTRDFLSTNENFLVSAPTGSGKTNFALLILSYFYSREMPVLIEVAQQIHATQWSRAIQSYLHVKPEDILIVTGVSGTPETRAEEYKKSHYKIVIGTPEALWNDVKREDDLGNPVTPKLDLSRFDFLIWDEIHHGVKKHAAACLAEERRISCAHRTVPQRSLGLSATPAETIPERKDLQLRFGLTRFEKVTGTEIPKRESIDLSSLEGLEFEPHRDAAAKIKFYGCQREGDLIQMLHRLKVCFQGMRNPPVPVPVDRYYFPSQEKIKKYEAIILKIEDDKMRGLCSGTLAEVRDAARLFHYITSMGRFCFLSYLGQRFANVQLRYSGFPFKTTLYGTVKNLEANEMPSSKQLKIKPPKVDPWETTQVRNSPWIREAFLTLARGTQYEYLVTAKNWRELIEKSKIRTESIVANHRDAEKLFFKHAMIELVRSKSHVDHPHLSKVVKSVNEFLVQRPNEKGLIYVTLQERTEFLKEVLKHHQILNPTGIISVTGKSPNVISSMTPKEQQKRFEDFRKDENKILIGTRCIAEGHDYPTAGWLLGLDPTSEVKLLMQLRGRVGRSKEIEFGEIVYYLTEGTSDPYVFNAGILKAEKLARDEAREKEHRDSQNSERN